MEHNFDVTPKEAIELQKKLKDELEEAPLKKNIKYIAGADVSFNKYEKDVYAGIIVFSYPDLHPVEYAWTKERVDFPYIPGLLSFREIPPLINAWKKIKVKPDVIMVDGQGIAHPRRLGIAAHFGLVVQVPTLGVAKKKLYGVYEEPKNEAGSHTYLYDPKTREKIGVVLRTKVNTNPLFISPGHLLNVADALRIVMATSLGYKLPEPTRRTHLFVNQARTGEV